MDGVGGDHQLARFLEDGGSHLGGAGVGAGDHGGDGVVARELLGDVGGLSGVEAVVEVDQLNGGAVDAAVLVDQLHSQLGGVEGGLAVSGRGRGGDGGEETDLDGVVRSFSHMAGEDNEGEDHQQRQSNGQRFFHH